MNVQESKSFKIVSDDLKELMESEHQRIGYIGWRKGNGLYPLLRNDGFAVYQMVIDSKGRTHTEPYWSRYSFMFHYYFNYTHDKEKKRKWLESLNEEGFKDEK